MTMREEFEAWMKSLFPRHHPTDDSELDRTLWAAWQASAAAERGRCADPLPVAEVLKIKNLCRLLDLDAVAFAWRIQRAAAIRGKD